MATELANSDEITHDVALEDIRVYKNELMNSINTIDYKLAILLLCNALFRFVKRTKLDLSDNEQFRPPDDAAAQDADSHYNPH
jgi:hypothetical protein